MFTKEDVKQIEQRGSSVQTVEEQVERFKKGFPWMNIVAPATPEKGILVLDEEEVEAAANYYEAASINGKCKFVPASGAASRMFKDLFSGLDALKEGKELSDDAPAAKFVDKIAEFAFYTPELFGEKTCKCPEYRKDVLAKTLTDEGLGYGAKTKVSDTELSRRAFSSSISILMAKSALHLLSILLRLRTICAMRMALQTSW